MLRGDYYTRASGPPPHLFEIDRDGDGRVSIAEFAEYYREILPDLVRPRAGGAGAAVQDAATTALFARLDADSNGKLSRNELSAAERILLALDADEDECVSQNELLAGQSRSRPVVTAAAPVQTDKPAIQSPIGNPREAAVFESVLPVSVVKEILKRYDKNTDGELSREESGIDRAPFERLDRDASGRLSAAELNAWRTGPPDQVLILRFASSTANCRVIPAGGGDWPAGWTVRQTEPNRLVIRIGSQMLDFNASSPPTRNQLERQFQSMFGSAFAADVKFVEEGSLSGPENQFLRVVFDSADFNGDGRLTREEFQRYFTLQKETTEQGLALAHVTRTPNLFQILDDNVDGKLGVRELRTSWDRLAVLEPSGEDEVTRSILQPSVSFRLTPAIFATYDATAFEQMREKNPSRGPLWFRNMDRNTDGDVSQAEFLGDATAFKLLDANGDGLIAREEAAAYEEKVRPRKAARAKYPWFHP
jgi:Ca2+-binding EF-hand superfamily protein